MTAINAYGKGALGLLMADTALYDHRGVVRAFGRKLISLPQLHMAIAVRGDSRIVAALARELERDFDAFDDVVARGTGWLMRWYLEVEPALDIAGGERHFDMVLCGWSAGRSCAEAYAMSSKDHRPGGGANCFELVRHDYVIAPNTPQILAGTGHLVEGRLVGGPERVLTALIDQQRLAKLPCGSGDDAASAHIVGGEAILVTISATGVAEKTVRAWSDTVGKKIAPSEKIASAASPRNRHQRRAAAAERSSRAA